MRGGGGGVRANLDAAGEGTYLIFPLVKLILGPPLPDNYCTVPKSADQIPCAATWGPSSTM